MYEVNCDGRVLCELYVIGPEGLLDDDEHNLSDS